MPPWMQRQDIVMLVAAGCLALVALIATNALPYYGWWQLLPFLMTAGALVALAVQPDTPTSMLWFLACGTQVATGLAFLVTGNDIDPAGATSNFGIVLVLVAVAWIGILVTYALRRTGSWGGRLLTMLAGTAGGAGVAGGMILVLFSLLRGVGGP